MSPWWTGIQFFQESSVSMNQSLGAWLLWLYWQCEFWGLHNTDNLSLGPVCRTGWLLSLTLIYPLYNCNHSITLSILEDSNKQLVMLGDVPSAHPSPVLFLSNLHTQPISKVLGLTSSEMKAVILCALIKKGIEVPNSTDGKSRIFCHRQSILSPAPSSLNNRYFVKE